LFDNTIWKLEMLKILKLKCLKLKFKNFIKNLPIDSKIKGKNFLIKELNKLKLKFKIKRLKDIKTNKNIKIKSQLKILPL